MERAEKLASFGSWEIDLQTNMIYGTDGAAEIYGLKTNAMPLDELKKIALPEFRGMLDDAIQELIAKGKTYNVRFKIKRPNDRNRHIHSISEYREDKKMIFGVAHDITEKVHSQSALHESFTDLNLAQQIAQIGNWKFDPENRNLQWSDQVMQIVEKKKSRHLRLLKILNILPEKSILRFSKAIFSALSQKVNLLKISFR
jgi:PAS domain S-box-containing protein